MKEPKIVDRQGQERDWDWLVAEFGAVSLERADVTEGSAYRIVKLQDIAGPAVQVANITNEDGQAREGVRVVRFWPDAPPLPAWPPPASRWHDQGVYGETNANGDIGYGMGHGDYYDPPAGGASAVWVADGSGSSDLIAGLGMVGGTAHRHLDVYFQFQPVEAPPEPPPDGPPDESVEERWQRLFAMLDRIIAMLEA